MKKLAKNITSFFSSQRGFMVLFVTILLFATVSRFYRLSFPRVYYFDEVYHALTSKLIAHSDPRAYEWWNEPVEPNTAVDWLHPPLAKYTQALSMKVFGENSFGWRFSSAIFGILVIAITALVAHVYFRNKATTLLAAFLASLDGLLLSQSRIAMNDIHVTFFILAAVAAYGAFRTLTEERKPAQRFLLLTGILSGLAMGSKWSGIYVLAAAWIAEIIRLIGIKLAKKNIELVHIFRMIVFLGIIPAILYIGSYTHMFLQGKSLVCTGSEVKQGQCYCSQESSIWVNALSAILPTQRSRFEALEARGGCKRLISHFSELHNQIWWYQTNLKATHPYESKPLQWITDMRPVWQYVDYSKTNEGLTANIYNVGNPILFWFGLVTVTVLSSFFFYQVVSYIMITRIRRLDAKSSRARLLVAAPASPVGGFTGMTNSEWRVGFLLLIYFIVWAPWTLSPRIMFFYHYAPAVPLLAILMAHCCMSLWKKDRRVRPLIVGIVIATTLAYFAIYPLNTAMFMPQRYLDTIFAIFPSWR